jgi:hypothetical protein
VIVLAVFAARPAAGLACELACGGIPETASSSPAPCHGADAPAYASSLQDASGHCTHDAESPATLIATSRAVSPAPHDAATRAAGIDIQISAAAVAAAAHSPPGAADVIPAPAVRFILRI